MDFILSLREGFLEMQCHHSHKRCSYRSVWVKAFQYLSNHLYLFGLKAGPQVGPGQRWCSAGV